MNNTVCDKSSDPGYNYQLFENKWSDKIDIKIIQLLNYCIPNKIVLNLDPDYCYSNILIDNWRIRIWLTTDWLGYDYWFQWFQRLLVNKLLTKFQIYL